MGLGWLHGLGLGHGHGHEHDEHVGILMRTRAPAEAEKEPEAKAASKPPDRETDADSSLWYAFVEDVVEADIESLQPSAALPQAHISYCNPQGRQARSSILSCMT